MKGSETSTISIIVAMSLTLITQILTHTKSFKNRSIVVLIAGGGEDRLKIEILHEF